MCMTKNTLNEKEVELVKYLVSDCRTTGNIQEKLKRLFAGTIEQMLEAEMEEHLGYEKNRPSSATMASAKSRFRVTATVSLSPRF